MSIKDCKRWFLGMLAAGMWLVVASACTVDNHVISRYYVDNQSGQEVTLSSEKKTVVIANGSRELVGVFSTIGGFSGGLLDYFFGDTLNVKVGDVGTFSFCRNDAMNSARNPYNISNWEVVSSVERPEYEAIFTIDEEFVNGDER